MSLKQRLILGLTTTLTLGACSSNSNIFDNTLGLSDYAIIGGKGLTSKDDISKSIVGIYIHNKETKDIEICTGSLLPNNLVITAAHCVSDSVGELDIALIFNTNMDMKNIKMEQVRYVDKKSITTWWGAGGHEEIDTGDIALLHFNGDVPAGYTPATILGSADALQDGAPVILAGYGVNKVRKTAIDENTYPDLINAVQLGTVVCENNQNLENCYEITKSGEGTLRQVDVTIANAKFSSSEITVDQTNGKGACQGDSGGPAYILSGGRYYLWGVTSRGIDDQFNDCSVRAAYTNIPFFATWLRRAAAKLSTSLTNPNLLSQ
ncbi:MAG: trypsin-like serine protease [Bdellovibrio sp.]|nr:trypsin-like serine protease [Bdellovibrio sp.]